jgi:hypothetical protein
MTLFNTTLTKVNAVRPLKDTNSRFSFRFDHKLWYAGFASITPRNQRLERP